MIKAPKLDFYGRGAKDDYQKNWDLGLIYQNELHASMKNPAYALRRDEDANQHNLLRWMICGSTPSDISDACVGAINSLMCVSFIMRRLQPLLGERHARDQSYTAYFRPDKKELNELYREVEFARNFLWCIDMIYESKLPAMNINSISLADRAAENQDRDRNEGREGRHDRLLPEQLLHHSRSREGAGEVSRGLCDRRGADVVGDGLIEDGAAAEDGATAEISVKLRAEAGGPVPQQGASSGGPHASDAVKIDNKIIGSIFRMNSGGDDDRWTIINPTAGHDTFQRGYQHRQQYRVPNHTNCIWAVSCRR